MAYNKKMTGVNTCYTCGKKLHSNKKRILIHRDMKHPRVFHIMCGTFLIGDSNSWSDYEPPSVQQQAEVNKGKYLGNGEEK